VRVVCIVTVWLCMTWQFLSKPPSQGVSAKTTGVTSATVLLPVSYKCLSVQYTRGEGGGRRIHQGRRPGPRFMSIWMCDGLTDDWRFCGVDLGFQNKETPMMIYVNDCMSRPQAPVISQ